MSDNSHIEELGEELRNTRQPNISKRLREEIAKRTKLVASTDGKIYAAVDPHQGHLVIDVEGQEFHDYLYLLADELGVTTARNALMSIVPLLRAQARRTKPVRVFKRIAYVNGTIYLDRCTETDAIIEITRVGGVYVRRTCPAYFVRTPDMRELPKPDLSGSFNELRPLVPQLDADNFRKLQGATLAAFHPDGPYPITVFDGEQDAGKSNIFKVIRMLIDPCEPNSALRTLASTVKDLWVQAFNERVLAFDNVRRIPRALEDELCQISTGGAFSSREFYSNYKQTVLGAKRPIFITSIGIPTLRADLLSRMLIIKLIPLPTALRRSERELDKQFRKLAPKLLGGLCKALGACLANFGKTTIQARVRMQDAVEWVTGAEGELGWPAGTFQRLCAQDHDELVDLVLESNPFANAVMSYMQQHFRFVGTALELLSCLDEYRTRGGWPGRNEVRNYLLNLSPLLRTRNIVIETTRSPDRRRDRNIIMGLRGIEWANLGSEGRRKLCIS